jgi:hypothetical protein
VAPAVAAAALDAAHQDGYSLKGHASKTNLRLLQQKAAAARVSALRFGDAQLQRK